MFPHGELGIILEVRDTYSAQLREEEIEGHNCLRTCRRSQIKDVAEEDSNPSLLSKALSGFGARDLGLNPSYNTS